MNGSRINSTLCSYAFCYSYSLSNCSANNNCGDPGCFHRYLQYMINITAMNIFARTDDSFIVLTDKTIGISNIILSVKTMNEIPIEVEWSPAFSCLATG